MKQPISPTSTHGTTSAAGRPAEVEADDNNSYQRHVRGTQGLPQEDPREREGEDWTAVLDGACPGRADGVDRTEVPSAAEVAGEHATYREDTDGPHVDVERRRPECLKHKEEDSTEADVGDERHEESDVLAKPHTRSAHHERVDGEAKQREDRKELTHPGRAADERPGLSRVTADGGVDCLPTGLGHDFLQLLADRPEVRREPLLRSGLVALLQVHEEIIVALEVIGGNEQQIPAHGGPQLLGDC